MVEYVNIPIPKPLYDRLTQNLKGKYCIKMSLRV